MGETVYKQILTWLMTYSAQKKKNVSLPSSWPPEIVFVNDEFVCKGTISCKSMYLTLDFSLIQKNPCPWKTNGIQIAYDLHRKKPYVI